MLNTNLAVDLISKGYKKLPGVMKTTGEQVYKLTEQEGDKYISKFVRTKDGNITGNVKRSTVSQIGSRWKFNNKQELKEYQTSEHCGYDHNLTHIVEEVQPKTEQYYNDQGDIYSKRLYATINENTKNIEQYYTSQIKDGGSWKGEGTNGFIKPKEPTLFTSVSDILNKV